MKRSSGFLAVLLSAVMLAGCASDTPSQSTGEATVPATSTSSEEITITTTTAAPIDRGLMPEDYMDKKIIALTFDDGPNTTTTPKVLDMLEKHGVIASFFVIGNNINDASAEVMKKAYDMGCEIHNHSKSHPNMTEMTIEQIIEEYQYTDNKVYEITGEHTLFFRPPYIAVNDAMLENIDVPFIAGIGCNDWDNKITADQRARSILRQADDGDIILLHDAQGNDQTVEALDTIIPELEEQGYIFVTMTELFELKGVEISPDDTKVYTNVLQNGQFG